MATPSFIFDASKGETPASVAARRKTADALAARIFGRAPQNVGEGLNALGQAWIAASMRDEANDAQRAGSANANDAFSKLTGMVTGQGAAASPVAAPAAQPAAMPSSGNADSIRAGLIERGMPEHVADGFIMNFRDESGLNPSINEAKPLVPGSRGGFGLAQWTGPRRVALEQFAQQTGRDVGDPNVQMDFLMQELQGPEANAAKSIMSAQSSGDAAAAIAQNFLRPAQQHLDRRVARYRSPAATSDEASIPASAQPTQGALPQGQDMSLQQLMQLSSNPWLNDGQRGVVDAMLKQKLQQQDPMRQLEMDYKRAQIGKLTREGGQTEYGLNPIYGTDEQGNQVLGTIGKDGSFKKIDTGGVKVQSGVDKIDLGTHFQLRDKRTGQVIGVEPKDLAGAEAAKVEGKAQGEAKVNLGGALQKADQSVALIDQMLQHPGLPTATGLSGTIDPRNYIAGTDATNFNVMRRQLEGKAFLEAFESLKGGGQITEIEGKKATEAVARLATIQSEPEYRKALGELRDILMLGKDRARSRAGATVDQNAPMSSSGWQDVGGVKIRRKQ